MPCDPYKRRGIVRALWKHFGAVPVLPIEHQLSVLKVLRKDKDGFRIVGDVASICGDDELKEELQQIIVSAPFEEAETNLEDGASEIESSSLIKAIVGLLGQGLNVSAGYETMKRATVSVRGCREKRLKEEYKLEKLLAEWYPDPDNPYLGWRKGEVELWVVDLVIEAESVHFSGFDKHGGSCKPFEIPVAPGLSAGASGYFAAGATTSRIFRSAAPVAFRGWRYTYDLMGQRKKLKPTKYVPDSVVDANVETDDQNSYASPDMAPFLQSEGEDKNCWYATVLPDNSKAGGNSQ